MHHPFHWLVGVLLRVSPSSGSVEVLILLLLRNKIVISKNISWKEMAYKSRG